MNGINIARVDFVLNLVRKAVNLPTVDYAQVCVRCDTCVNSRTLRHSNQRVLCGSPRLLGFTNRLLGGTRGSPPKEFCKRRNYTHLRCEEEVISACCTLRVSDGTKTRGLRSSRSSMQ